MLSRDVLCTSLLRFTTILLLAIVNKAMVQSSKLCYVTCRLICRFRLKLYIRHRLTLDLPSQNECKQTIASNIRQHADVYSVLLFHVQTR